LNLLLALSTKGWKSDNTERLVELYKEGKSFDAMEKDLPDFSALQLAFVYGNYDRLQKGGKEDAAKKPKRSRRGKTRKSDEADDDSQ
jgi:hypothetical protein